MSDDSGSDDDFDSKGNEALYERIWKHVYPLIKKLLIDDYQSVNEMLCMHNWPVVHTTCRNIISKGMVALRISNPHAFDKAVCWKVVTMEWDLYTKWRCVCVFFLAAAMELVMVKRWEDGRFERVKAGEDSTAKCPATNKGCSTDAPHPWSILDLFNRMDDLHRQTVDLHAKHDRLHEMHRDMQESMKHSVKSANTQVVHVTYGGPHAPSQALIPFVGHDSPSAPPPSAVDLDDFMRRILEIMRANNGRGYSTRLTAGDEPGFRKV